MFRPFYRLPDARCVPPLLAVRWLPLPLRLPPATPALLPLPCAQPWVCCATHFAWQADQEAEVEVEISADHLHAHLDFQQ